MSAAADQARPRAAADDPLRGLVHALAMMAALEEHARRQVDRNANNGDESQSGQR